MNAIFKSKSNADPLSGPINSLSNKTLVIGHGQIHKHIPHLFSFLRTSFVDAPSYQHERNKFTRALLKDFKFIILAVPDRTILNIYTYLKPMVAGSDIQFIHLSGSQSHQDIIGLHPLMTFSNKSEMMDYNKVPLFCDHFDFYKKYKFESHNSDETDSEELRQTDLNLNYIRPDDKPVYHAVAVMTANFIQAYLQKVKIQSPFELDLYQQLIKNSVDSVFLEASEQRLTGPWVRQDYETIKLHLSTLKKLNPELFELYNGFSKLIYKDDVYDVARLAD